MTNTIGLGTWQLPTGSQTTEVVQAALRLGYRSIDTAYSYGNEFYVGRAVQRSGIAREELRISGKVWNTFRTFDEVITCCQKSLKLQKLAYFDCCLLHWPVPITEEDWQAKNAERWAAMEALQKRGLALSIGVSNFHVHHLEAMGGSIAPAVNQIEFHPGWYDEADFAYCREHGIAVEGWSPLGSGNLLKEPLLADIGAKYGKSPAQVCLRWGLQQGVTPVVRSSNEERLQSNLDVFDFALTDDDMQAIASLRGAYRSGWDADNRLPE